MLWNQNKNCALRIPQKLGKFFVTFGAVDIIEKREHQLTVFKKSIIDQSRSYQEPQHASKLALRT